MAQTSCSWCVRPPRKLHREPARYETRRERILVRKASSHTRVEAARYGWRKSRVLVRPASTQLHRQPAQYGTRTQRVLVRAATTHYRTEPAIYKTVRRRHVSTGCRTRTVRTTSCNGCVTTCKVSTPVRRVSYSTHRVKVRSGRRYAVRTPAQYSTRRVRVKLREGRTTRTHRPAVYAWRRERVMIRPAKRTRIHSPAQYSTRTVRVKTRAGRTYRTHTPAVYSWRQRAGRSPSRAPLQGPDTGPVHISYCSRQNPYEVARIAPIRPPFTVGARNAFWCVQRVVIRSTPRLDTRPAQDRSWSVEAAHGAPIRLPSIQRPASASPSALSFKECADASITSDAPDLSVPVIPAAQHVHAAAARKQ